MTRMALLASSVWPAIVTHANLDQISKITEYQSSSKQEAVIEANRSISEAQVLQKTWHN